MNKQANSCKVLYFSREMLSLQDSQATGITPHSLIVGQSPLTDYIQEVSQPAAKKAGGPPKNHTASVRKLYGQENIVPIRSQELLDDIAILSGTALRHKYHREESSHRNFKSRSKNLGYEWHPDFECFKDFLLHVGQCPGEGYTLDRIDSSDPEYAPGKVRWASKAAQTHNRQNTRYLPNSQGVNLSASEWERCSGIPAKRILERVDRGGWSVDEATTIPVGGKRPRPPVTPHTGKASPHHSSSTPLVSIWMQLLADVHGQEFCSFTGKERAMIKVLANRFESGGLSATQVLTLVLTHWNKFTLYAKVMYGAYGNIPMVPTLQFLTLQCTCAGNFFRKKKQEDIEEARRQAEQDELQELEQARIQRQADMEATPEYMRMKSALDKLNGPLFQPDSFVTPKMREYAMETYDFAFQSVGQKEGPESTNKIVAQLINNDLERELTRFIITHEKVETYEPSPIFEAIA